MRRTATRARLRGIVVGQLAGLDAKGAPVVDYPGNAAAPLVARTCVTLRREFVGREITLAFDGGDPERPVVMGIVQSAPVEIAVDGDRVVLTGKEEIVLRCGKASLVLTRAGKVLLRGAYVSSRSSGVNRVKGGSVQIN